MDTKTDHPRNKGGLSQNHNFYKKINLDGCVQCCVLSNQRGQAHLPNPELIGLEFQFFSERRSRRDNRTSHSISQVGKVGLPRCLSKTQFEALRLDGALVEADLVGI